MKLIVDVKVVDLSRAIEFYTKVLGLEIRVVEDEWAAVIVGDAELHLYVDGGVTKDIEFYVDDIDAKVLSLKEKGVMFFSGLQKPQAISADKHHITTFPWGRTAFFKDSEGNELAIVQDA